MATTINAAYAYAVHPVREPGLWRNMLATLRKHRERAAEKECLREACVGERMTDDAERRLIDRLTEDHSKPH